MESPFNEAQRRRLLASARHADKLLGEIEQILRNADSKAAFPRYRPDLAPHETRLLEGEIARLRSHLSRALGALGVRQDYPQFSALEAIRATLAFVRVAVQEMAPEYLRGYGAVPEAASAALRGLSAELEGILNSIERSLALGGGAADLEARIDRLDPAVEERPLLRALERAVSEGDLTEFRAPLLHLVERAESRQFEIAVFGRVTSGKSSLLNAILGAEILPVGINPMTTVPVRLVYGEHSGFEAALSGGSIVEGELGRLEEYASEERNPGNQLGVVRVVVRLPSPRLASGLVFVDTPGFGAAATAGVAETLSYLPRCDLGIVLVSAVTPIAEEDLTAIESLAHAAIPTVVVLSKADLVPPEDLEKALAYTRMQIAARLGLAVDVAPLSTRPGYEELLEKWFAEHLAPLEARHQELVRDSLRRKVAALEHRVADALRAMLGQGRSAPSASPEALQGVERRLREVTGRIDEERRRCLEATDRVRLLARAAIERAARELAAPQTAAKASAVLSRAAEALAAEAASDLAGRLRALAWELESACRAAAEVLEIAPALATGSLAELVRELPRWDFTAGRIEVRRPGLIPSRAMALAWLVRRLRLEAGDRLEAAFNQYGRALERWLRERLADLQDRFETEAGSLRAQLARLERGDPLAPGRRGTIERLLKELEAARLSHPAR